MASYDATGPGNQLTVMLERIKAWSSHPDPAEQKRRSAVLIDVYKFWVARAYPDTDLARQPKAKTRPAKKKPAKKKLPRKKPTKKKGA